jgi:hypothetical protein
MVVFRHHAFYSEPSRVRLVEGARRVRCFASHDGSDASLPVKERSVIFEDRFAFGHRYDAIFETERVERLRHWDGNTDALRRKPLLPGFLRRCLR